MSRRRLIRSSVALLAASTIGLEAEELRLPVAKDTSIAASPSEQELDYGGSARIKMKGIENVLLFEVDASALRGQVVEDAVLHLRGCDDRLMVRKVGVSSVAVAWNEGHGKGTRAAADASCFLHPGPAGSSWGGPGSTFLDALWGRSGTSWEQALVEPGLGNWYAIAIDGRLLEACAAGLSHGFALSDDNGQTMAIDAKVLPTTNHSNNDFFAREQSGSVPYLTLRLHQLPVRSAAPKPLELSLQPWPDGARAGSGGLEVAWAGPDGGSIDALLGYRMRLTVQGQEREVPRWQLPPMPHASERVRALLPGCRPGSGSPCRSRRWAALAPSPPGVRAWASPARSAWRWRRSSFRPSP